MPDLQETGAYFRPSPEIWARKCDEFPSWRSCCAIKVDKRSEHPVGMRGLSLKHELRQLAYPYANFYRGNCEIRRQRSTQVQFKALSKRSNISEI